MNQFRPFLNRADLIQKFPVMFYSQKRMGFSAGLRNSWSATRYKKFSIFVSFLYLSLLIELLTLVTTLLFRGAPGAEVWVGAFLTALGRQIGRASCRERV